ncbi:MAG: 30S ribosomal protein S7 [Chloroflexi bacterium RBG_16_57_9]|nr:MAG: 30S ribosomal protein S7 [Chloroflexi bacterium RBG_16_57_9]
MPRRGRVIRRDVEPDPKYNSVMLSQFVNKLMERGKKSIALRIIYDSLVLIEERQKRPGMQVFEQAIKNATPILEVKPRRVGGSTYQVPMEIRADRRLSLAMRWLIQSARARGGKSMAEKLAAELMDAAAGTGNTIKKKEDTHKMAEANKAFAHYRW